MPHGDDALVRHLLRRAGFGASSDELAFFGAMRPAQIVEYLVRFEDVPDETDDLIGRPGYVSIAARGVFQPNVSIFDARQRWLFRLVHGARPLQEKMTLFWHNHFATAYSKVAGAYGPADAARMMAAKPSEDPKGMEGQIETIRRLCVGSLQELVLAMARDPAMLVWLDGRFNTKEKPQENFGRELMELFSMGVRYYTEADVYAAARVFTGWNLARTAASREDPSPKYEFQFRPGAHDTSPKTFSFPIYGDGSRVIPARAAAAGMQDGIDLITAVTQHPETARRLVRRLYSFFVSELHEPPEDFVRHLADVYLQYGTSVRATIGHLLRSPEFSDESIYFSRYSWPVEHVVRAIKDVGWNGYSLADAAGFLTTMGQQLYEPPDVAGWELGAGWISSGAMLSRMNFASALAGNQRANLAAAAMPFAQTPENLLSYLLDRLSVAPLSDPTYQALLAYAGSVERWTGSEAQVRTKVTGLVHLILGSGEYVFV